MGFFGTTVARLALTEIFKAGLAEGMRWLNPDEMIVLLQQAEVDADTAQGSELFPRIDRDGASGYRKFLKFFQSGLVQNELQKPFQNRGKPDVKILLEVFKRSASEHPEADRYLSDLMLLWMDAFVESYFDRVGICFQIAKEQYLKQLARRVDDVKFVGIAVPGEEVEKQEVLAQIFVMPDVREEKRNFSQTKTFVSYVQPVRLMRIMDGKTGEEISITQIPEQTSNYQTQTSATPNNILEEQKSWAMRDRSAPRISAHKVINLA